MKPSYSMLVSIAVLSAAASASTIATPNVPDAAFSGDREELEGDAFVMNKTADEIRVFKLHKLSKKLALLGDKIRRAIVDDYDKDIDDEFTKLGLDRSRLFAKPEKLDKWVRIVRNVYKGDNPEYALGRYLVEGSSVDEIWKQVQLAKQDPKLKEDAEEIEAGLIARWALRGDSLETVYQELEANFRSHDSVDKLLKESPLDTLVKYTKKKYMDKSVMAEISSDKAQKEAAKSLVTVLTDHLGDSFVSRISKDSWKSSESKDRSNVAEFISMGWVEVSTARQAQKAATVNSVKDVTSAQLKSSGYKKRQQQSSSDASQPSASSTLELMPASRPDTPPSSSREQPISSNEVVTTPAS